MNWLSLLIGLLVGWLIEWVLDYLFWRRRARPAADDRATVRPSPLKAEAPPSDLGPQLAQLEQQRQQLADCEARVRAKEEELQGLAQRLKQAEEDAASWRERFATAQAQTPMPAPERAATIAQSADDLTVIEGIGPKIAELLQGNGIATFKQLAEADLGRLQSILAEAGPRFRVANPASWPEQARLAERGDWDGLKSLQDKLTAGQYGPS